MPELAPSTPLGAPVPDRTQITISGYVVLFAVFAVTCFSFGYQTLHRFDVRHAGPDPESYYAMVQSDYAHADPPMRFRVLVPWLASLLYRVIPSSAIGAWDPDCLALLIVNSVLMSLACLILLRLGELLTGSPALGLIATFMYLSGWTIVNLVLGGALADTGEILILFSLTLSVLRSRWWCVPLLMVVAPVAKETTLVFGLAFCFALLACIRLSEGKSPRWGFAWTVLGLVLGIVSLYAVRHLVGGTPYRPHAFSWHRLLATVPETRHCLNHEVLLAMGLPIALGAFRLARLPRALLAASLLTALLALGLAAYAETAATVGRYFYNTIGPLLSISGAILIREFWPASDQGCVR